MTGKTRASKRTKLKNTCIIIRSNLSGFGKHISPYQNPKLFGAPRPSAYPTRQREKQQCLFPNMKCLVVYVIRTFNLIYSARRHLQTKIPIYQSALLCNETQRNKQLSNNKTHMLPSAPFCTFPDTQYRFSAAFCVSRFSWKTSSLI